MRLIPSIFAATVLLISATGCPKPETGSTPSGPQSASGRLFDVTFQTMNNPFFVDLNEGIEEMVKGHGDRLVTLDAQFNSLKQKNDISDLILQGATAIFINPVNWEGIRGSLLQARDNFFFVPSAKVKQMPQHGTHFGNGHLRFFFSQSLSL